MTATGKVEVSEQELNVLKDAYALLNELWTSDKSLEVKRLVKAVRPATKIPEIDLVDTVTKPYDDKFKGVTEAIDKIAKRLDERDTREAESAVETKIRTSLDQAQKRFGLTEDSMAKVIARMKENNNPDALAAAAFVASELPRPQVNKPGFMPAKANLFGIAGKDDVTWGDHTALPDDASLDRLHKDSTGWFDAEVNRILSENAA